MKPVKRRLWIASVNAREDPEEFDPRKRTLAVAMNIAAVGRSTAVRIDRGGRGWRHELALRAREEFFFDVRVTFALAFAAGDDVGGTEICRPESASISIT